MVEQQLRFAIPSVVAGAIREDIESQVGDCDEAVLSSRYFDTVNGDLAQLGVSLRLHRESGQWIQSWVSHATDGISRIEHHLPLSHGALRVVDFVGREGTQTLLADTAAAKVLQDKLKVRFQIVYERLRGVVMTDGPSGQSSIEMTLDTGEIRARSKECPVLELNFELLSGDLMPMLELAAQWQNRYQLSILPVSKAEFGDRLARRKRLLGVSNWRVSKLGSRVTTAQAAQKIVDACIVQISRNALALSQPDYSAQHLRQCRDGLARLDAAIRVFDGAVGSPSVTVRRQLKELRKQLGIVRNGRLLRQEFLPQLYAAGCGPLGPTANPDNAPLDPTIAPQIQRLLMGVLFWRHKGWTSEPAGERFREHASRQLSRRIRRIRRRAARFDTASLKQRRRLLENLMRLQFAADYARPVIRKKQFLAIDTVLSSAIPALQVWCDLQQVGQLLQGEKLQSDDRSAYGFAAGWIAGRTDAMESQLHLQMKNLARQKFNA